ncbi:DUF3592 domain-containing protein [Massilia sp. CF038]|uniref:DUF3592 domain-containing protein n=1 Tax=Massilia sp. CF038 TaxID=1881045 RepID=UPI0009161D26|nr:DUF3592 domain-containing protein [Massilia sp. CF038]SHH43469.1 hypothetical protein SAMN05428948_4017 [Massilia sp. CF038]
MLEPRQLPWQRKCGIFFGHPFAWIGVLFFVAGCVFTLFFARASDFQSPFLFRSGDPLVAGVLVDKQPVNAAVNKQRIYQYNYRYRVGAARYQGQAFSTYTSSNPGDAVLVQYAANNPARSRIDGMRLAPFSAITGLMTAIFPAIGFLMLYFAARRCRRYLHLVRYGVLTTGKVARKVATSTRINRQTVYQVYFQFQSADGVVHEACVSSHQTAQLGDEAREPLVYDASEPRKAVLLDAMPPAIRRLLTAP